MRADTGTPELGITGVDLTSLVPAGKWGDATIVQEEWSKRDAKRENAEPARRRTPLRLKVPVTITQGRR
jgi:hypothetical protein